MYSVIKKATLELELLYVQAGPPDRSWTLLPPGVSVLVMAKAVFIGGILLPNCENFVLLIQILRGKKKYTIKQAFRVTPFLFFPSTHLQ